MGSENKAGAKIEIRYSPASRSVSSDIARDIAQNHLHGNIIVVGVGNPVYTHAAFRKQWLRVMRSVEREQARSINPQTRRLLARQIADMQSLCFTTLAGTADSAGVVRFTTVTELIKHSQPCKILYLAHPIDDNALHIITNHMPSDGCVIRYLRPELKSEYTAIQHPWRLPM